MKNSTLLLPLTSFATAVLMIGFVCAAYIILQASATLPNAETIRSVELKIPLRVYSAEGLLISEFGDERRKPVAIDEIPQTLINSVLASEDDGFYQHSGIDFAGLFRAALSNFQSGKTQQGASTITMQVARNFFLSREKTYTRKLNEVLLAFRLEQILSKNEILNLYLNKIFLGHRAYGFGAAAEVYYGRELDQLSIAETAMLAGLPKAPSTFNPIRNPERAVVRRNYVLGRLRELNKISEAEYQQAVNEPVTAEKHSRANQLNAPHIAEMARSSLIEVFGDEAYWGGLNVFTTIVADKQIGAQASLRKGLQNYDRRHGFRGPVAKIDLAQFEAKVADSELPAMTVKEQYVEYLSTVPNSQEQIPVLVLESLESIAKTYSRDYGEITLRLEDALWARRHLTVNKLGERPETMTELVSPGDVVYIQPIAPIESKAPKELSAKSESDSPTLPEETQWRLSQIPNISGALISIEPSTGRIISLVGGYDFFLNKYNRAIQSIRQPGSNIKPFIYSASLNKGFTPASLISGAPIVVTDPSHGTIWRPENYSGKFFGPTRMREALSKSLNLVSIRLLRAIGIPYARSYLERFGLDMSRFSASLTMALGSGGVTPLEMLSAYGTLANTGYQVKPYFISYVTDRDGQVIYQAPVPEYCDACYAENLNKPSFDAKAMVAEFLEEQESLEQLDEILQPPVVDTPDTEEVIETYDAPRVMTRSNNFLTVSMLKDVVRLGTARKALALNRQDLAGKTGTTNDYIDAWFSGFNSQVATTVWVGFDEPASMGRGEAGSVAALPIWVDYMSDALKEVPHDNQEPPSWIEQGLVNRETGVRTNEEDPDAVIEYFPIEALLEYPSQEFTQDQVDIEQDRAVLKGLLTRASKLPAEDENHPVDQLIDEQLELTSEEALLNTSPTLPEPENPGRIIEEQEDTEGLF